MRSFTSPPPGFGGHPTLRWRRPLSSPARSPAWTRSSSRARRYLGHVGVGLGPGPAQLRTHQGGDVGRGRSRPVKVEDAGPQAAIEHVPEGTGHLVADGVHHLRPQVGEAVDQRFAERPIGRHQVVPGPTRCRTGRPTLRPPAPGGARRCGGGPGPVLTRCGTTRPTRQPPPAPLAGASRSCGCGPRRPRCRPRGRRCRRPSCR